MVDRCALLASLPTRKGLPSEKRRNPGITRKGEKREVLHPVSGLF